MSELDQSEQSSPPHSPRSVESAARESEGLRRQGPSLCSVPPHHTAGMEVTWYWQSLHVYNKSSHGTVAMLLTCPVCVSRYRSPGVPPRHDQLRPAGHNYQIRVRLRRSWSVLRYEKHHKGIPLSLSLFSLQARLRPTGPPSSRTRWRAPRRDTAVGTAWCPTVATATSTATSRPSPAPSSWTRAVNCRQSNCPPRQSSPASPGWPALVLILNPNRHLNTRTVRLHPERGEM